ncbi:MAG: DUF3365 domain-containing protein [Planctomycetota bacterium]
MNENDETSVSGAARDDDTELVSENPAEAADDAVGSSIGPYKVLQHIGEGGFGVVYMAQQVEPVKRVVALKIVKLGMDTKQVVARFEAERQALAMMDHPNIARVLDAGATETGRPYFVMELVRGVPITEYCDKNKLAPLERLALFETVCYAVQHAHQKGIIHRDIKPSNVMVTLHDGHPVPKVIDFGVAKAINQQLTDHTLYTEYRQFVGTPAYMSPEQAEMSGLDVDTRADIYSLGVLLYELLTGTTPLDERRLRETPITEVHRLIREEDPDRPSTRVTTRGDTSLIAAQQRRTDVPALKKLLSGDLDWIVMKALEKDRTRRYSSASALAEDMRRFLAHDTVQARPPSSGYRLRKFARRNRAGLATASAIVAGLLVSIGALGYGLWELIDEREVMLREQTVKQAQTLLDTMNAVRDYTGAHVRPYLGDELADDSAVFPRESVPGYSARTVFTGFQARGDYQGYLYKEAADNPSNPDDLADGFELELLSKFRDTPSLEEHSAFRIGELGNEQFFIARPMIVNDASCLRCHGDRGDAPAAMFADYGEGMGGFGWEMGEVVAAQIVYVPASRVRGGLDKRDFIAAGALGGMFLVLVVGSLLFLRSV